MAISSYCRRSLLFAAFRADKLVLKRSSTLLFFFFYFLKRRSFNKFTFLKKCWKWFKKSKFVENDLFISFLFSKRTKQNKSVENTILTLIPMYYDMMSWWHYELITYYSKIQIWGKRGKLFFESIISVLLFLNFIKLENKRTQMMIQS